MIIFIIALLAIFVLPVLALAHWLFGIWATVFGISAYVAFHHHHWVLALSLVALALGVRRRHRSELD